MRPAWSVIFLTTLIGAGQGLFIAIMVGMPSRIFNLAACSVSLTLCGLGLIASFFHLGRPERAWRAAAMWRTSWLSREVIALPVFMALVFLFGYATYAGMPWILPVGFVAVVACVTLFYCTSMIYACVKFLQEWASPYTLPNFAFMGLASGFTLAAPLASRFAPGTVKTFAIGSIVLTAAAFFIRLASLAHNKREQPKSTLQTAIGVRDAKIRQISQGFTGDSFNTLEFSHGATQATMDALPFLFLTLGFVAPIVVVGLALALRSSGLLLAAFVLQYAGLLIERWFFLAQANHPQNLYYQSRA